MVERLRLPDISEKEANFREYLRIARRDGLYLSQGFVEQGALDDLRYDLKDLKYKLVKPYNPEKVIEKYFIPEGVPLTVKKKLDFMKDYFGRLVRQSSVIFSNWSPNQIAIQRYGESSMISDHKDIKEDYGVILVLTISGQAVFTASHERHGKAFFEEKVVPGDLVILRGSPLESKVSECVFHSITAALTDEPRISVGFRDRRR